MLPRRDGLSVIDEMRHAGIGTPVLILSARRSVDDRVRGLQAGGDDYLTKPFAFAELLARVQALVRRASRTPEPTTLTFDDLALDLLSRRVTRGGDAARSAPARVRAARVSDAQRRPGGLEDDDPVARVGLQLRSTNQHRGRPGKPAAREDRPAVREEAAPHRPRRRLCHSRGRESFGYASARPVQKLQRLPSPRAFGLRLALWYATLFVVGSIAIVFLTYCLHVGVAGAARSSNHRREAGQYAAVYARGGIAALADTVRAEQRVAPERLFVRVATAARRRSCSACRRAGTPRRSKPRRRTWSTARSSQVGKSTEAREDLLARFRAALGLVTLSIVVIALSGGLLATRTAMRADSPAGRGRPQIIAHRPDRRARAARRLAATRSTN